MAENFEKVIKRSESRPDYAVDKERRERPSLFPIWYVEPRIDPVLMRREAEKGEAEQVFEKTESYLSDREKLFQIEKERNEKAEKDRMKRLFYVKIMTPGDIFGEIRIAYEFPRNLECLPEIIIIRSDKENLYGAGLGYDTAIAKRIREEIGKNLAAKGVEDKKNLYQPIIIAVSDDEKINEKLMEQGANLVMPDFRVEDVNELAQFAAKVKSDPASLAPEKVIEEKREFYEKVAGMKMEDRSKITADTERELEILNNIFEKHLGRKDVHHPKNILDVGSGEGRISVPLAKDPYFNVKGLENNPKLRKKAEVKIKKTERMRNAEFFNGNLMDYANHEKIPHGSQDAVIYTWHSFLEAFGPGNTLRTLNSAWLALKKGGILVFDQPTRKNKDMADGWYYDKVDQKTEYLSYIMTEDEIKFMLRIAGFEEPEFIKWKTKPSREYPEGMEKITVVAKKR